MRVIVVDDHPLYRDGVTRAIKARPELDLIGEAADGEEGLEMIERLAPDVAVLDIAMPKLDGMRLLSALKRSRSSSEILFLSGSHGSDVAYEALAEGAKGFLLKGVSGEQLCDAIAAVARGETVLAPDIQAGVAAGIRKRAATEGAPKLTDREQQVLAGIAEGLSAREIGDRLHVSAATVKTHTSTLYEKLGVSERGAAVAEGMRRGLLR